MLVLSRKENERIFVGDNIVITVAEIDRWRVRIGIDAPKGIPIWREELQPKEQGNGDRREEERPVRLS